jgi:membrane-associated protease RseP (regulator of RpoE activity)
MRNTTNADTLQALALAIQELASKLTTDTQHAQAAFGPILQAIEANASLEISMPEVDTSKALWPLLQAFQLLAPQLTPDQAQAVLGPVLEPMRDTLHLSLNALQATAATVHALPVQPTAEQMQLALGGVLDMLVLLGPSKKASSQRVGIAIAALASKLTPDQAAAALHAILHAMFSRGWLGVGYQNVSDQMADSPGLPEPRGVLVTGVIKGSPADNAKILAGDVILAFDGKTIDQVPTLARVIASERPGKEAVVTLRRGGEKKNLTVTLGEDSIRLGEDFEDAMKTDGLTAMANALKALPVQLTAEQARMARDGILEALRRSTPKSYTHHAMAEVVEAVAPKLSDEAKADMLGLGRSGLAAAGNGRVTILWARAYEALLPPSPANGYVASIVEVLKYPNAAIETPAPSEEELRRNPSAGKPSSASEYFHNKMSERLNSHAKCNAGIDRSCDGSEV